MLGTANFLVVIVAGTVVLAGAVFVIALLRQGQPTSQPDDTPGAVALSYLLAVQLMDYERATRYLLPDPSRAPETIDVHSLLGHVPWLLHDSWASDTPVLVDRVRTRGDRATVSVMHTWLQPGGMYDSGERSATLDLDMRLTVDGWRIVPTGSK